MGALGQKQRKSMTLAERIKAMKEGRQVYTADSVGSVRTPGKGKPKGKAKGAVDNQARGNRHVRDAGQTLFKGVGEDGKPILRDKYQGEQYAPDPAKVIPIKVELPPVRVEPLAAQVTEALFFMNSSGQTQKQAVMNVARSNGIDPRALMEAVTRTLTL